MSRLFFHEVTNMKIFAVIFVSLFLVNAQAEDKAASGITVNTAPSEASPRQECINAYSEYSTAKRDAISDAKENKEEADEKLLELKKEKNDKANESLEKIAEVEKESEDAEAEYAEASKAVQDQLDELEKTARDEGDALIQKIQKLVSELEKNLTTDRSSVNTEFQNSIMAGYEQCRMQAEASYLAELNIIRDGNAKNNKGFMFKKKGAALAGPSKVKKARANAKALHAKCVSETKRVLESKRDNALKELSRKEKEINQEITQNKDKLDRVTNTEYQKKVSALQKELAIAGKKLKASQSKAAKDSERLAAKSKSDSLVYDEQIGLVTARSNAGQNSNGKGDKKARVAEEEENAAASACCEGGKKGGAPLYPDSRTGAVCEKEKEEDNKSKDSGTVK